MKVKDDINKYLDYIIVCSPKELNKLLGKVKSNTYRQAILAVLEKNARLKDQKMMDEFLV